MKNNKQDDLWLAKDGLFHGFDLSGLPYQATVEVAHFNSSMLSRLDTEFPINHTGKRQ